MVSKINSKVSKKSKKVRKTCTKCGQRLLIEEFPLTNGGSVSTVCKECHKLKKKTCCSCHRLKDVSEFPITKGGKVACMCIECRASHRREYKPRLKTCAKCGRKLPPSSFTPTKSGRAGTRCDDCVNGSMTIGKLRARCPICEKNLPISDYPKYRKIINGEIREYRGKICAKCKNKIKDFKVESDLKGFPDGAYSKDKVQASKGINDYNITINTI